jgi:hypothetical protein
LHARTALTGRAHPRPPTPALAALAQAAVDAENNRIANEVEARLRAEQRAKAIAHQGELAVHTRLVKQSQMEGALNENYMSAGDKMHNANLVRAVIEHRRTGRLVSDLHAPLG